MIHSITLPGHGRIHAETEGRGEAILFLHADFVDGRMWNSVREQLADRFLVATFDKLGYGRSDAATGPVPRRDELKAVVEALNLGPLHLVGCSNGGRQALDFALEHPDLVKSLTLVNAAPSGWEPEGPPPAPILAMIGAFQKGDLPGASELQLQIWFDGPERSPATYTDGLRAARVEASVMNRTFVDRGTFFIADAVPLEPLDPPALKRLGGVRARTLVVDGRFDWSENRRASKLLAQGIGASHVEVDAAHVPPMEDARAFALLLSGFLTQTAGEPILKVWPSSMRPI